MKIKVTSENHLFLNLPGNYLRSLKDSKDKTLSVTRNRTLSLKYIKVQIHFKIFTEKCQCWGKDFECISDSHINCSFDICKCQYRYHKKWKTLEEKESLIKMMLWKSNNKQGTIMWSETPAFTTQEKRK